MSPNDYDPSHLSTKTGLLAFLASVAPPAFRPKGGSIDSIDLLEGGNANFVYRVLLEVPFQHDLADRGMTLAETVVIKHAEDYLKNSRFFALQAKRMVRG